MHFVAESVPSEITLMFISYLMFCTVLMYLFVKTDREWGRMEVSLDDAGRRDPEAMNASALLFSSAEIGPEPMFADVEVRQSLQKHRPETLGQASRISGVTPAAISLLMVHLKRRAGKRTAEEGVVRAAASQGSSD